MDIEKIIENKNINVLFQLVISPNKEYAAGVEALSRGIDENGNEVSATLLFKEAINKKMVHELEKVLIYKSIENFKKILDKNSNLLLFLNISETIMKFCIEEDYLTKVAEEFKVSTKSIVIDIDPTVVENLDIAMEFSKYYRERHFYICVDNIGDGYFNLDKILYLMPDIVKVNIFKLRKLKNKSYSELLLRVIKQMTDNIGVLMVAMGVETEDDVIDTVDAAIQFMQGFFVSKPLKAEEIDLDILIQNFREMVKKYYTEKEIEIENSRIVNTKIIKMTKDFTSEIDGLNIIHLDMLSKKIFKKFYFIENIWILDKKGIQVYETFVNHEKFNVKSSPIFNVYNVGSDFSNKEIYTMLESSFLDIWVTRPYNSLLTNNICIGCSTYVTIDDRELILCVNINYDSLINYLYKYKHKD